MDLSKFPPAGLVQLFLVIVAALLFAHQLFFHPLSLSFAGLLNPQTVLAGSSNCVFLHAISFLLFVLFDALRKSSHHHHDD